MAGSESNGAKRSDYGLASGFNQSSGFPKSSSPHITAPADVPPPVMLAALIGGEVIPRLIAAHRADRPHRPLAHASGVEIRDLEAFCVLLIANDLDAARRQIADLRRAGLADERVLVELLAPSARHLGDMWLADRCSFADVTTGLGTLQMLLRLDVAPHVDRAMALETAVKPFCIRLLAMPGEQHTLGILIVEEFFRKAGWQTSGGQPKSRATLLRELKSRWFDAVGVSVSARRHVRHLPELIEAIRTASRNPSLCVVVGGDALVEGAAAEWTALGADLVVADGVGVVESVELQIGASGVGRSADAH